jgi:hypothetical protein
VGVVEKVITFLVASQILLVAMAVQAEAEVELLMEHKTKVLVQQIKDMMEDLLVQIHSLVALQVVEEEQVPQEEKVA